MAERRMFHGAVVGSDEFLDLPVGAQALYFHMGMRADDDGFVNGPRQIVRSLGLAQEDLELLIQKKFLLWFDGVAVIRHWRMANSLQNDRIKPLNYPKIAEKIFLKPNRIYTLTPGKRSENLLVQRKKLVDSNRNPFGIQSDSGRIPRGKETNRKKKKLTEMNGNEWEKNDGAVQPIHQGSAGTAPPDGEACGALPPPTHPHDDREDASILSGFGQDAAGCSPELKIMGGKLGKGVVMMSDEQMNKLLETMGLDAFDKYTEKLADFIIEKKARVASHYQTILKWWREDMGIEN